MKSFLLALCLALCWANSPVLAQFQTHWWNKFSEERYFLSVITFDDDEQNSKWDGKSAIPLSLERAITQAKTVLQDLSSERVTWLEVQSATIKRAEHMPGAWYWIISFKVDLVTGVREQIIDVAVKLDGTAIRPIESAEAGELRELQSIRGSDVRFDASGHAIYVSVPYHQSDANWIDHLSRLKSLRELRVMESAINGAHLKRIRDLKNLQRIELMGCSGIDNADWEHLAAIASLQYLDCTGTEISDEGTRLLSQSKSLQKIVLSGTKVTGASLKHLGQISSLRTVNIEQTACSKAQADEFKSLHPTIELVLE